MKRKIANYLRHAFVNSHERAELGAFGAQICELNKFKAVAKTTGWKNEVCHYIASDFLGWNFVPVTVERVWKEEKHSFQWFVPQSTVYTNDMRKFDSSATLKLQYEKICLFDIIVGNYDRNSGNMLVDTNSKLWGIDGGYCFDWSNDDVMSQRAYYFGYTGKTTLETIAKMVLNEHADMRRDVIRLYRNRDKFYSLIKKYQNPKNIKKTDMRLVELYSWAREAQVSATS